MTNEDLEDILDLISKDGGNIPTVLHLLSHYMLNENLDFAQAKLRLDDAFWKTEEGKKERIEERAKFAAEIAERARRKASAEN